jgi:hypothetical protein
MESINNRLAACRRTTIRLKTRSRVVYIQIAIKKKELEHHFQELWE